MIVSYYFNLYIAQNFSFNQFKRDFADIRFLSWLGVESNLFLGFIGDLYLKLTSFIRGDQSIDSNLFDDSLIDIHGKILFDDEIFLFDSNSHLLRDSMTSLTVESKDLESSIIYPWFCSFFKEPIFHSKADPSLISWYYNERLVSFSLYHYTASAFFFNGYVNKENFGLRKISKMIIILI